MKIIVKKTVVVLAIFAMLLFAFGLAFNRVIAKAEEITITEETSGTEETTETEEEKKVNALIAKVNEYLNTANGVFETRILPIIISCGTTIVTTAFCAILTIRKVKKWKDRYNQVASAYNELEDKAVGYKGIIDKSDNTDKIKAELGAVKAELKEDLAEVRGIVYNIRDGALQAWAESPDAVRALVKTETKDD